MVGEFSFNNYRFFANDSKISFVADRRTKRLLSNCVLVDNRPILKSAAIYGGNNSGKTNVVALMKKIKSILKGKENVSFNSPIFKDNPLFFFSITYNNRDDLGWIKYDFLFNHEKNEYIKETISKITYYETGNPSVNIILDLDREAKRLKIYDKDKSSLLNVIVGQKPFLYSVRVDDGELFPLSTFKKSFEKLSDSFVVVDLNNFPFDNTLETYKSDNDKKKQFITSFVKHADLSIENFSYNPNSVQIDRPNY